MAVTTKILSDTKTHAKVLLTWNADSATTAAWTLLDCVDLQTAQPLKLYGVGLGECKLEFKGASSDVEAINLCGSGHYYGAVIKNTATNTTATGGDIKATTSNSSSGFALLTLQKQDMGEND